MNGKQITVTSPLLNDLSDILFWDTDKSLVDVETNAPWIIQRVLEYGSFADWRALLKFYGIQFIVTEALKLRTLEPKALAFISTISDIPVSKFRCYTTRQSNRAHWIY